LNVEDLRRMTEDELIRRHNSEMQNRAPHYNIFLDEMRRREMVEQGERMETLTRSINRLTWVITGATLIGVGLTAWTLLAGG
jgi:hypothetical protein